MNRSRQAGGWSLDCAYGLRGFLPRAATMALLTAMSCGMLLLATGCERASDTGRPAAQAHVPAHDHDHDRDAGHAHDHHHDHGSPGHSHQHAHDHAHQHPASDPSAACSCGQARLSNGWCRKCNTGYVAGLRVSSARLFEALDPHGHELGLDTIKCATCRGAMDADGFCGACRMGFVDGMAYFTRLTHGLARGTPIEPTSVSCETCRSHLGGSGWCAGCGRGTVGNVAIADRGVFDATAAEFAVLQQAIDREQACELCACAMVVHRTCPKCLISYESTDASAPNP